MYAQHPCAKRSKGKQGLLVSQSSQSGSPGFKNTVSKHRVTGEEIWHQPLISIVCEFMCIHLHTYTHVLQLKLKTRNKKNRVNKIAQQLKGASCRTMTRVNPETHKIEGENQFLQIVLWPPHVCREHVHSPTLKHTTNAKSLR